MTDIVDISHEWELELLTVGYMGTSVVLFTAPAWCHPCQNLEPHFIKAAEAMPDITFIKVDVDTADPAFVGSWGVQGVPQMFRLDNGKLAGSVKGRTVVQLIGELNGIR